MEDGDEERTHLNNNRNDQSETVFTDSAETDVDHIQDVHASWPTLTEVGEELQCLSKLGFPILGMNLLWMTRSIISMSFLGHLGGVQLAGSAMAISFGNVTGHSLIFGLSSGLDPLFGQAFGARRHKAMGLLLQQGILLNLFACIPISALWLCQERLLVWCGQDRRIAQMAQQYLLLLLPDLFASCLLQPLRAFLRSQRITQALMVCAALALAIHVPLNWFLVFALDLKVAGCALASAWTSLNMVLFMLIYIWRSGVHHRTWPGFSPVLLQDWSPLVKLALPSCLGTCLEWWCYEIVIILAGLLPDPTQAVSTMAIVENISAVFSMLPWAIGSSVSTRVGNELGANHPSMARLASIVSLVCSFATSFLGLASFVALRQTWGLMFTRDRHVLTQVSVTLPVCGFAQFGSCLQTASCGVLRGCARPGVAAKIYFGAFYVIGIPVAVFLGFGLGLDSAGLWGGLAVAQSVCAVLAVAAVFRTSWLVETQRAKELTMGQPGETLEMKSLPVQVGEVSHLLGERSEDEA